MLAASDREDADDRPPDPWGAPVEPEDGEPEEGMRLANAAVMAGVTDDLMRRVPSARRVSTGRREGPEEARRHHSRTRGRSGGTLASHQPSLSAQICRSEASMLKPSERFTQPMPSIAFPIPSVMEPSSVRRPSMQPSNTPTFTPSTSINSISRHRVSRPGPVPEFLARRPAPCWFCFCDRCHIRNVKGD